MGEFEPSDRSLFGKIASFASLFFSFRFGGVIGYLVTVSGLGGLAFLNNWLKWYAAHAYWFYGSALLFLGMAVYVLGIRYPTRKNKIILAVNIGIVIGLTWYYWL